ncbi:hypothetical protein GCM10028778_17180 [Barrientosiimonas marina]|uniref:Uncharacterized protein n=1 Tax=Lentibacillus kimchii TaxID=1542911 RepID=A0ABW2UU48_9BACI
MKQRTILLIAGLIVIAIALMLVIPRQTAPSSDTRIVLEHSKQTYIAPPCFEQADPSNNLEDATLDEAKEQNYEANGSCTKEALNSKEDTLLISLLKDIGILNKKWDTW